jgi:hypothetical protein
MSLISKENLWKLVAGGTATLAGIAVQQILRAGWKAYKQEEPPVVQPDHQIVWKDALIWTIATGAAVGVAQLVASRGAVEGWKRLTGETPPMV